MSIKGRFREQSPGHNVACVRLLVSESQRSSGRITADTRNTASVDLVGSTRGTRRAPTHRAGRHRQRCWREGSDRPTSGKVGQVGNIGGRLALPWLWMAFRLTHRLSLDSDYRPLTIFWWTRSSRGGDPTNSSKAPSFHSSARTNPAGRRARLNFQGEQECHRTV
jgi:hypothetical protein